MKKIVTISLLAASLSACVGDPSSSSSKSSQSSAAPLSSSSTAPSSAPRSSSSMLSSSSMVPSSVPRSSSSAVLSSSSAPQSSSSVIPSSSSVASSSSIGSTFNGNAANGKTLFAAKCGVACHQDPDGDGFAETLFKMDVDKLTYATPGAYAGKYDGKGYSASGAQSLALFIAGAMSVPAGGCDKQCSEDIAAYLWNLRDGTAGPRSSETIACETPSGIDYGPRTLRVLTSYEYQNSLQVLFNKPLPADYSQASKAGADITVNELPNHINETVGESRINTYDNSAKELAQWAVVTSGALPFACTEAQACASSFIKEFAYVAFRRPLTAAEKTSYTDIITKASSLNSGLEWAIRSVLMSPQFLYRSELGTKISDLLTAPAPEPAAGEYDFAGTPVVYGADKFPTPVELYGRIATGNGITYAFTKNDLIRITVSGKQSSSGVWPTMEVGYNGGKLATLEINHSSPRTYSFYVNQFSGNEYVYFLNSPEAGHNPGHSFSVSKLEFGAAKAAAAPVSDTETLKTADPTAYALDAFEYASALSFMYTGSTPDKGLLDAAAKGELFDKTKLASLIDGMLDSPQGQAHVGRFAGFWFRSGQVLSEARTGDDSFTQAVRKSMALEIPEMFKHVFYNDQPYTALYEGNFTLADSVLGAYYGLPGAGASPLQFKLVDTTDSARGGVIASGSFMMAHAHMDHTSPIQRAVRMRQDVLCQAVPQPQSLDGDEEEKRIRAEAAAKVQALSTSGKLTDADFFDIQTNTPGTGCASCHNAVINPLFGMDDFDHVGKLRKVVNGKVVQKGFGANGLPDIAIAHVNDGGALYSYDTVGQLIAGDANLAKDSGDGKFFKGAKGLSRTLVQEDLPGLATCLIEKTNRFAMGFPLSDELRDSKSTSELKPIPVAQQKTFACVKDDLIEAYENSNQSPRDVMKALGTSSMLRFRR